MKLKYISLWTILVSLCLISACSHEQDASIDEDWNGDPVAIRFGEGMPRIAPATKGLGPMDDWNPAQDLYVYGIAREGVNAQATADSPLDFAGGILINNVKAESAPSPNENPSEIRESITVYSDPDLQIPFFYAPDRRYEFFGYYVDDAVENPSPTVGDDSITLPFVIDGSQDIMVASTDKEADAALATQEVSFDRLYSATSARRGVVPNLVFSHQLSRFNVQVRSGSKPETTNNMRLSYLRVQSATEGTLIIATREDKEAGGIEDPANPQFLDLQRYGHALSLADNVIPSDEWTELGDVLVMPGDQVYKMKVGIVQMGYTAEGIPAEVDYDIDLSKLVVDSEPYAQPGIQYNVKIVLYGLEEINVSVTLVAWEEAGEMFVDPDEESSYVPVSSIELSEDSLTLQPGESATLTATVYPSDASDKYVTWSSSDNGVATVTQSGVVTAVAAGTAIITARASNKTRACSVTVEGGSQDPTVPEAVDLGLSVKWASVNLGAQNPEDYGDRYAWGEVTTKTNYTWNNYKWCNGTYNSMTKYCTDSSYGIVDNKVCLDDEDDAARVVLGGKWRMPTVDEAKELHDDCTWSAETVHGVKGYRITGENGNSIFIPLNGQYDDNGLNYAGTYMYIWVNQCNGKESGYLLQASGVSASNHKHDGLCIRPVYGDFIAPESITLNKPSLTLSVGDTEQLIATVSPSNASDKTVTWITSDAAIATVNSQGVVTAMTTGTATITAKVGDKSATCTVTVTASEPVPGDDNSEGYGSGTGQWDD